jgi:hypothetical protein
MKVLIYRLLAAAAALDLFALALAFSLRHAKHGAGEIVGSIAWFTLLADALLVIVLAAASLLHAFRNRRIEGTHQPLVHLNRRSSP